MAHLVRLSDLRQRPSIVTFDRRELRQLLGVYSPRVISGEWRDYALDLGPRMAAFSIFRHAAAGAVFTVTKLAPGAERRGDFMLLSGGRTLRQGRSLAEILSYFDHGPRLVVTGDRS